MRPAGADGDGDGAATVARPLHAADVPAMTCVLADAFMDDPLYRFLAPSPQARQRWLRWVMGMFLRVSHRFGGALCLDATPGAGVLCLIPPDRNVLSFQDYLRAAPGVPPLGSGLAAFVRGGLRAAKLLDDAHVTCAHYYVLAVGVAPGEQGKGIGGALVRAALRVAAARELPCYLETASPSNVALYEHLGFEVQRAFTVPELPPLWTMLARAA